LPAVNVPAGCLKTLGQINVKLKSIRKPSAVKLTVSIPGTKVANDWNLWVYPDTAAEGIGKKVLVASELDERAASALANGGRIVLLPQLDRIKGRHESWQPIFWNNQWIRSNNRSLGLLCDVKHSALAGFPTELNSDWQWHDIMNRSVTVDLTDAPAGMQPIVQIVPDWNNPRREALLFECKIGKGRLLICSSDLSTDIKNRTAARQLRKSLLKYAAGKTFNPRIKMTLDQVRAILMKSIIEDGA